MAVSLDELNELTLRVIADGARDRLTAGTGTLLDTLILAYYAATPEQRRALTESLFRDLASTERSSNAGP